MNDTWTLLGHIAEPIIDQIAANRSRGPAASTHEVSERTNSQRAPDVSPSRDTPGESGDPVCGRSPGSWRQSVNGEAGQPRVASSDWPARAPCTERGVGVANENRAGIGKAAGRQCPGGITDAPHISARGDER